MTLMDVVDVFPARWNYLKKYVPDLEYQKVKSDYRNFENIVGHIQRAFIIYWAIKEHERTGGIGLDIGCGQVISPFCVGTDYYAGSNHPQYGGAYWPHVRCLGEILAFKNEKFDFIVSHHSINYMSRSAFTEWLRVLKVGGRIALVTTDKRYDPNNTSYVTYYSADEFKNVLDQMPNIKILEYNTFDNHFSINALLEKTK